MAKERRLKHTEKRLQIHDCQFQIIISIPRRGGECNTVDTVLLFLCG